jgi:hypothetical protein
MATKAVLEVAPGHPNLSVIRIPFRVFSSTRSIFCWRVVSSSFSRASRFVAPEFTSQTCRTNRHQDAHLRCNLDHAGSHNARLSLNGTARRRNCPVFWTVCVSAELDRIV